MPFIERTTGLTMVISETADAIGVETETTVREAFAALIPYSVVLSGGRH